MKDSNNSSIFTCSKCNREFESENGLRAHARHVN